MQTKLKIFQDFYKKHILNKWALKNQVLSNLLQIFIGQFFLVQILNY